MKGEQSQLRCLVEIELATLCLCAEDRVVEVAWQSTLPGPFASLEEENERCEMAS